MNLFNVHAIFSAYDRIKVATARGKGWIYEGLNFRLAGTEVLKEYANCPINNMYISDIDNSLCVILKDEID